MTHINLVKTDNAQETIINNPPLVVSVSGKKTNPNPSEEIIEQYERFKDTTNDFTVSRKIQENRTVSQIEKSSKLLIKASKAGDLAAVKNLIKHENPDVKKNNSAALRYACKFGHTDIVKKLLKKGSDPTELESQAFRKAVRAGKEDIVDILLDHGKVDAAAQDNEAIRSACENNQIKILDKLLQNPSVDPGAKQNEAFITACKKGYVTIAEKLIDDSRVDLTETIPAALKAAITCGQEESVKLIISSFDIPGKKIDELFAYACRIGNTNIVETLIQAERKTPEGMIYNLVDPTANENAAIREAAKRGNVRVIDILLSNKQVDPGDNFNEALYMAAANGHDRAFARLMMDKRTNVADENNRALEAACEHGHSKIVRLILNVKNDYTQKPPQSFVKKDLTPGVIKEAVMNGFIDADLDSIKMNPKSSKIEVAQRLTPEKKQKDSIVSEINITKDNNVMIRKAAENGHAEIVEMLIAHGADPSANDNEALRKACQNGHVNTVKTLLKDKRVDPEALKSTPLSFAIFNGHKDVVEALVADPRIDENQAYLYLGIAKRGGNADMIKILNKRFS